MSRSTYSKPKPLLSQIGAGIHLLTIIDAYPHLKENKEPIMYNDNPVIIFRFSCDGKIIETNFYIGGSSYKILNKMLRYFDLDPTNDIRKTDVIGLKVWGYIREVWHIKDYQKSGDASYELFDVSPSIDTMRPVHSDELMIKDGIVQGDFVRYIETVNQ